MPDNYDVVVIGAGPVGLMLSACLTRLGPYKIKHIDKAVEPTRAGRASGIQPRTLDVLSTMGLKRPIWAYNPGLIQEVAFWATTTNGKGIQRTGTSKSYPEHVDTRYPFTTILHQGRVERIFLDDVRSRGVQVERSRVIRSVRYLGPDVEYPVEAELASVDGPATETVRTKYLFGADGARSAVRAMLGIPMVYKDPTVHVWGVIDGVVTTDFPDMQIKCTIRTPRGACMVIPHGNNRVRIYVQMSREEGEAPSASGSQEKIQRTANNILSPYKVEWECVDWHSVYPIGQGIAQQYSMYNRIFIGGDACHTHSPKAGQGMNYGILDAHNLAWKLHLVECGLMRPDLLETYEEERRAVASRLIEFDATYAGLFSSHNPSQETNDEFVRIYKQNTQLTSGYGVEYPANKLTQIGDGDDIFISSLAKLQPGRSFPPVNVTRVIDARNVSLEREVPFNGSFNIVVFAGQQGLEQRTLVDLASQLGRRGSVFSQVQKNEAAVGLPYERRHNPHSPLYTFSIVFNQVRASVAISALPHFFLPYRYHVYSDDARAGKTHETGQGVAHRKLGFDPREGGVVVVRPDGYVGCVVRLVEGRATADALDQYFSAVVPGEQPSDMVPSML